MLDQGGGENWIELNSIVAKTYETEIDDDTDDEDNYGPSPTKGRNGTNLHCNSLYEVESIYQLVVTTSLKHAGIYFPENS